MMKVILYVSALALLAPLSAQAQQTVANAAPPAGEGGAIVPGLDVPAGQPGRQAARGEPREDVDAETELAAEEETPLGPVVVGDRDSDPGAPPSGEYIIDPRRASGAGTSAGRRGVDPDVSGSYRGHSARRGRTRHTVGGKMGVKF